MYGQVGTIVPEEGNYSRMGGSLSYNRFVVMVMGRRLPCHILCHFDLEGFSDTVGSVCGTTNCHN